jgi:hypothetical protein
MKNYKAKKVSALARFLMWCNVEDLILFLHRMHLRYTIIGNDKKTQNKKEDKFTVIIFKNKKFEYKSTNISMKSALADTLARFFINESEDYHRIKE